jgi:alkylation response protein AidB-like acyl-CoA dehydrogenase
VAASDDSPEERGPVDFEFSDDQEQLRDSVRRYLADRAPLPYVRAHYEDAAVVDAVWAGLADLGLTGMVVPEAAGGAGRGMVDLALPLGEMGRTVYPGPFAASAVGAAGLLADLGPGPVPDEWLGRLAAGTAVATLATDDPRHEPVRLDGGALTGTKQHVPDGVAADLLLVAVADTVVAVPTADPAVTVTPTETVDGSRKFASVTFAGAVGTVIADAGAALAAATDRLGLAFVLDGVGAAERALELAVEYAKEREQFGKPIGSFQAVQHLCADMLRSVELGRAAAYYAAWTCDEADPAERHRAVTMARAFAADGFYRVGATAIQVFGGIGFTWEHDIHLFYKRLLTLQHLGGSASDHLEELATLVLR